MQFEVGEIIIHAVSGRHGRLIAFCDTRAPMVEVRWKDLSVTRVPIDLVRKRDNLPVPVVQPPPPKNRRYVRATQKPQRMTKFRAERADVERDRISMKKLYQQKSGDYSY